MHARFSSFSLQKPRMVYWLTLVITVIALLQFPSVQIDTDPENMLPESDKARVFHNQIKQQFAMSDTIVVGVVNTVDKHGIYNLASLSSLSELTHQILTIKGVITTDVMSIPVVDNISQSGPGTIRFEWMMNVVPVGIEQAKGIGRAVSRLPLLNNTLVSGDRKAAAIYVPVADKNQSYVIAEQIRDFISQLQSTSNDEWFITGLPVAEDQFGHEMFIQMAISAPLAGVMIFVLLWYFFRNLSLITAPMIVAMVSVIVTMGLLIGAGFDVHILSSMIAIFLMPIAVVDSVHVLSEFVDRYKPELNSEHTPGVVIAEVMSHLFQPMLFTSVTSSIGFFSLMLTPIPPVQIFGAFVGFGILLAFILTVLFLPAWISRMSPSSLKNLNRKHQSNELGKLALMLRATGKFSVKRSRWLLVGIVWLSTISVYGILSIQINDNPVKWFKAEHEIRVADRALNQHFAGTYDAWLVIESTTKQEAIVAIHDLISQITMPKDLRKDVQHLLVDLPASDNDTLVEEFLSRLDDYAFSASDIDNQALERLTNSIEIWQEEQQVILQTETLTWIEGLQQSLQTSSLVGKSNAVTDVIKTVNRELHGGADNEFVLPQSARAASQILLQYQSSHRPWDLWHFITPDFNSGLIWLQLTSGDNQDMSRVVEHVNAYITENPVPVGLQLNWAGKAYLNLVWQEKMVSGMLDSLISAFVVVFIMMVVLFRSFVFGLLAMLPLTLTITAIYGVIGWIGKDYDMPVAVLSALTLGLSVDFAIHFLERAKALFEETRNLSQTLTQMFEEPARAISRNAIVIAMGFTPLLFAPLIPYVTVGVFLASIMVLSALVTLMLLPALLSIFRSVLR